MAEEQTVQEKQGITRDKVLFWGCFIALIATAFGFIIRALIIGDWAVEFDLTETQKGELMGVGLWPFAISIVLFSLVIDRIGYGRAMVFAFVCHVVSAIITIGAPWVASRSDDPSATAYWTLYIGQFIVALGNGTVEAVINPVVATIFPKEKTKWLNILHAGWPGGLVLGGIFTLLLPVSFDWQWKIGLILIPTVIYGLMLVSRKFPVHERVAAGISYRDMLGEAGILGCLIVVGLMTREVGRVFEIPNLWQVVIVVVLTGAYGAYVRTLGRPLFIFLLLIMCPLAITELGTDTWITELMKPEMVQLGLQAGWVLVYTSLIMMILRFFFAGPIVQKLTPLGLLSLSAVIAILGLAFLSRSAGIAILAAATVYGLGKSFFWPTMLGVVAEQFPRGGALTINTIAGVGMLAVGTLGAPLLGYIQDTTIDDALAQYDTQNQTALHEKYTVEKESIFGTYQGIDTEQVAQAPEEEKATVTQVQDRAKKNALLRVAIFPSIMLVCYLILLGYFRSKGGYAAVHLDEAGLEESAAVER